MFTPLISVADVALNCASVCFTQTLPTSSAGTTGSRAPAAYLLG